MHLSYIFKKPLLTEKALQNAAKGIYSFVVDGGVTKHQLAKGCEDLFNVKVSTVRTITRKGKVKRVGRKMQKKERPEKKIAIITLKEGKIDVFPQP